MDLMAVSRRLTAATVTFGVALGVAWVPGAWASASFFSGDGLGTMTEPRYGPAAATLPDGKVLLAGGDNYNGVRSSAELFDPATETFTAVSNPMASPRWLASASPLPNGDVLIAGGSSDGSHYLTTAELFDPATETFTALTSSMTTARPSPIIAPLPDGDVLIAGGNGLNSAELFDPATETFTAISGTMTTARYGAVAAPLPDGDVLIAGGAQGNAELFDPTTETFTAISSPMTTARELAVASSLPDGEVLIAGGTHGGILSSAELFDPTTETFTAISSPMTTARYAPISAPLPGDKLLIAGGAGATPLSSAEIFYPAPQATVAGGDFGDQTVAEPSPVAVLAVTNVGAQALTIGGATLEGTDAADFAITADACAGRTLAYEQTCTITARFTPSTTGLRQATIALSDNEPTASTIALSGTGVAANAGPQGPQGTAGTNGTNGMNGEPGPSGPLGPMGAIGLTGSTGLTGEQGPAGKNGANGANGAPGPTGPQGPAGQIELVTCKPTPGKGKHKKTIQQCTSKLTSSPVTFKAAGTTTAATLARGTVVYATGSAIGSGGQTELLLNPRRRLTKGNYTLTLMHGHRPTRKSITIG